MITREKGREEEGRHKDCKALSAFILFPATITGSLGTYRWSIVRSQSLHVVQGGERSGSSVGPRRSWGRVSKQF